MLPPMAEAARQWVLGDRAYVGLLAGKDGACANESIEGTNLGCLVEQ